VKVERIGKDFELTWLGHAAFKIVSPCGINILIDPWLSGNPMAAAKAEEVGKWLPPKLKRLERSILF
jgi:L-ascorbate metabolism protein UlaG (beta-lactamase superfamily)